MDTLKVSYTITEFNQENKSIKVKVEAEGQQSMIVTANVSPLLAYCIKQGIEDSAKRQYLGKTYTSTLKSPSFDENPLKLKQFIKDGVHNGWRAELVFEKKADPIYDIYGRIASWRNKYLPKSAFTRYQAISY